MRYRIFLFLALVPFALGAQNVHKTVVTPQEGECWWGAVMNKGYEQPYCNFSASDNYYLDDKSRPAPSEELFDLCNMSAKAITAPVLLSSKGRYVWGNHPFAFKFRDGVLYLESAFEKLEATSEFKKVAVNVSDLGFKKASDILLFRFTPNEGTSINIRHMVFVENPAKEGDLTGDDKVNAADVQKLLNIIAAEEDVPAADLTGDGKVNAADVQKLLNIIAAQ